MTPADPRPPLTGPAASVYAHIMQHPQPPPTRAALAAACHLSASAITAALDTLRTGGYVRLDGDTVHVLPPRLPLPAPTAALPPAPPLVMMSIGKVEGNGVINLVTGTGERPVVRPMVEPDDALDVDDVTLQYELDQLPRLAEHPLRSALPVPPPASAGASSAAGRTGFRRSHELHFQLGLRDHKDVLPIPVLHGDVLGRAKTAQIHLHWDTRISSKHCEFELRSDKSSGLTLHVRDCNSCNGTFINGVPAEAGKWIRLTPFARLRVGVTTLVVLPVNWGEP